MRERHCLEAQARTAPSAHPDPVGLDQPNVDRRSRMDAVQQRAMALARMRAGDYGLRLRGGEPIAPRRLAPGLAMSRHVCRPGQTP